jgi:hypothetical protein
MDLLRMHFEPLVFGLLLAGFFIFVAGMFS